MGRPRGLVLPVALVLLAVLALLGRGWTASVGERARAGALADDATRARRAAAGFVRHAALRHGAEGSVDVTGLAGGGRVEVSHARIAPHLVRVTAVAAVGRARARATALSWTLDPLGWLADWPGGIIAAGTTPPADRARIAGPEAPCADVPLRPHFAALPAGVPRPPALGRLAADEVARRLGAAWHPDGLRVDAPWAGLVATSGDVVVGPGGVLEGLVLAGGDVRVVAGGELRGMVVAAGVLAVERDGGVRAEPCAALAALRQATEVLRPFVLPGWWGLVP